MKHLSRFNQFVVLESKWSSSLKEEQIIDLLPKIYQVQKYILNSKSDYINKIDSILEPYDKIVQDFLVELFTINYWYSEQNKELVNIIIELGDKAMTRFGTEPRQVLNAIENVISYFSRFLPHEDDILEERVKSQRYKGKKIPGKYLTKNPGAMKKEIDRFRGKKEYKKDWDADYTSGKGGKGKRVKTKKSAATKAYQRMFGDKEKEKEIMKHLLNFEDLTEDFSQYLTSEDLEISIDDTHEFIEELSEMDEVYEFKETNESKKSGVTASLKKKSKSSGIPVGILRKVFSKGMQAWNAGHRPGVAQHQWGMGRVNSFITGSGGARKADADLWAKAKSAKSRKKKKK